MGWALQLRRSPYEKIHLFVIPLWETANVQSPLNADETRPQNEGDLDRALTIEAWLALAREVDAATPLEENNEPNDK